MKRDNVKELTLPAKKFTRVEVTDTLEAGLYEVHTTEGLGHMYYIPYEGWLNVEINGELDAIGGKVIEVGDRIPVMSAEAVEVH